MPELDHQVAQAGQHGVVVRAVGERGLQQLQRLLAAALLGDQRGGLAAALRALLGILDQLDEQVGRVRGRLAVTVLALQLQQLLQDADLGARARPEMARRRLVGRARAGRLARLQVQIAELFEGRGAGVGIGRALHQPLEVAARGALLAALEREIRQGPQRRHVGRVEHQRRLVQRQRALGVAQLDLGLGGVRQAVGDLRGVQDGFGVVGQRRQGRGGLAPLAGAVPVLAERQLHQHLARDHALGVLELAVRLVEAPLLLQHLGQPHVQAYGLLGVLAHAPQRLGQPGLGGRPLAFAEEDVGRGEHRGQVVGRQRQRLVQELLRFGDLAGLFQHGAGELGQDARARLGAVGQLELSGQTLARQRPLALRGVHRGQGRAALRSTTDRAPAPPRSKRAPPRASSPDRGRRVRRRPSSRRRARRRSARAPRAGAWPRRRRSRCS